MPTVSRDNPGIIYAVTDTREPLRVRYYGKTTIGLKARVGTHWSVSKNAPKDPINWFLRKRIDEREFVLFSEVDSLFTMEDLNSRERELIAEGRAIGMADLNILDGGDGTSGFTRPQSWKDFMSDRFRGEGSNMSKLTWAQVREIREIRCVHYIPRQELADSYGVAGETIGHILRNGTWFDPAFDPARVVAAPLDSFSTGAPVGTPRLSANNVAEMRELRSRVWVSAAKLAAEYGVAGVTITRVLANLSHHDPLYDPSKCVAEPVGNRALIGECNPASILTLQDVQWIRTARINDWYPLSHFATMFGVTVNSISRLLTNRTWYDPEFDPSVVVPRPAKM